MSRPRTFSTFAAGARWLGLALVAGYVSGCSLTGPIDGEQSSAPKGEGLRGVTIPKDFTFKATRSVALVVSADEKVLPAGLIAGVEVARPDGKVVYRGPLSAASPAQIAVAVPLKDASLNVTLRYGQSEKHAAVAIADRAVNYTFQ